MCLHVPRFQKQIFKHGKVVLERSKEMKEQKKNKGSVLIAESAYNAQNAQFGLVMQRKNTVPDMKTTVEFERNSNSNKKTAWLCKQLSTFLNKLL